jgi:hypothetical protein
MQTGKRLNAPLQRAMDTALAGTQEEMYAVASLEIVDRKG